MVNPKTYKMLQFLSLLSIIFFVNILFSAHAMEEKDEENNRRTPVQNSLGQENHRTVKNNLLNRDLYAATLAVEREEGEKVGEKRAKRAAITQMRSMNIQDSVIVQALQITEQQLQELMTEEDL